MALTADQITKLANRKGVKTIAVENFLGSLGGQDISQAYSNCTLDARLYNWNAATQKAIRDGIQKHFAR